MAAWLLKSPVTDIGKVSGNGCPRRHHRADQMSATASPLTSFEVAVAGGGTALAGLEDVRIHAQAHRTSGFTPLETCFLKNSVQALEFGGMLDGLRPRHNHGANLWVHAIASCHACCSSQVFKARVGTGSDEHPINRNLFHARAGLQSHVL